MLVINSRTFKNGTVYALQTNGGNIIETTDTFLPHETINADYSNKGNWARCDRWMIGVSVMSGCPVGCLFCATASMSNVSLLTSEEIIAQIDFILASRSEKPVDSKEFKINLTRMGEPFLNISEVKKAVEVIRTRWPYAHIYISTIGVGGSDYSFIDENVTLQFSIHALDDARRKEIIPFGNLMTLEEIGKVRVNSRKKVTLNLTLTKEEDFSIDKLKQFFDPKYFFIKLSPLNNNETAEKNNIKGVIL